MGWLRRRNFFFLFIPQFQDRRLSVACNCCVAQKLLSEALWCWMLHLCHTAPSVGSFLSITLFGNTLFIHVAILVGQLYRNSQHLGIWSGIFYTMTYQCSQDTWRTTKTSGSPQKDPKHLTWTQIRAFGYRRQPPQPLSYHLPLMVLWLAQYHKTKQKSYLKCLFIIFLSRD